ncbi:hypothetical protein FK85_31605, partial [Halorubrum saccharovorum]
HRTGDDGGSAGSAEAERAPTRSRPPWAVRDEEVADALDATTDGGSRPAEGPTGGDAPTASDGPTEIPPEPAPPGAPDADPDEVAATTGDEDPPSSGDDATDRATVRITRDVGSIFGVDEREYDLASEDVVTLPAENADPLVQRDAAERLD